MSGESRIQNVKAPYLTIAQGDPADVSTPDTDHWRLLIDEGDGHLKLKNDAGTLIDLQDLVGALGFLDLSDVPAAYTGEAGNVLAVNGTEDGLEFVSPGGGGSSLSNSSITPTTTNVPAVVGTRYFADISGLTADRNFILPTCASGDEIELKITVGDDTYELIIIGDTGVTIDGGSAATEWSRLFIAGEVIRLVASGADAWRVVHDGRIPCEGKLTLSGADTTNTGGSETPPTWDTAAINQGNLADLANAQFVLRRAGKYEVNGGARSNGNITDQQYYFWTIKLNGVDIAGNLYRAPLSGVVGVCGGNPSIFEGAAGDTVKFHYASQANNMGISNSHQTQFWIKEV